MLTQPVFCSFPDPQYLIFSENVPPLVYYSHFMIICVAVLASIFVLVIGRKELSNRILFLTLFSFTLWVFLDSVFWAANNSDVIMFVWSLQILFEPLVYLGLLYLFYILLKKRAVPLRNKIIFFIPYIPILVAVPTSLALPGFDLSSCLSIEGFISIYYTYPLELFYTIILGVLSFRAHREAIDYRRKNEILLLTIGAIFFLLAFSWGNIVSSFTENWNFAQIGLFAMPVFIGFLAYSIVRFQTFNTKLVGSAFLMVALWLLELALLFLQIDNQIGVIIIIITLVFTTIFGILLIKSVQREVNQRLKLEQLTKELQSANISLNELDQKKSEFISIASHQLRTPLSIIKGYVSLIQDGAYGKIPAKVDPILKNIYESNERLVKLVDEFLDVSRLESGRTQYSFSKVDISAMVDSVVVELSNKAKEKNIELQTIKDGYIPAFIIADEERVRHGMFNYLDNAIKYSPKHTMITIKLSYSSGRIIYGVTDQGVGMDTDDIRNLFQKFYRSPKVLRDFQGTGLGLFVVKEFIEAHGGEVSAISPGIELGSTFKFWVPIEPTGDIYEKWKKEHQDDK